MWLAESCCFFSCPCSPIKAQLTDHWYYSDMHRISTFSSTWVLRNGLKYLETTANKFRKVTRQGSGYLAVLSKRTFVLLHPLFIMANTCIQFTGFLMGFLGWIGLIIATATNDWVVTCKYNMNTCRKMDELEAKGLWADCVISTALYHCISLTQILELPGGCELVLFSLLINY